VKFIEYFCCFLSYRSKSLTKNVTLPKVSQCFNLRTSYFAITPTKLAARLQNETNRQSKSITKTVVSLVLTEEKGALHIHIYFHYFLSQCLSDNSELKKSSRNFLSETILHSYCIGQRHFGDIVLAELGKNSRGELNGYKK
jgi:hypothetical protein